MSFWPRLRRRSRGRKRSSAKPNPYASIGLDKLAVVHAEFDAQRALFAAEKGVPVSSVRFVSGSPRGWTLLPHSAISPTPEESEQESNRSSTISTASSSLERKTVQVPDNPKPGLQTTPSCKSSFPLVQPILDSGSKRAEEADTPPSSSVPAATSNAGSSNLTEFKSWNTESQVVLVKGQTYNKLTKTTSVVLISLGVFSTLGFNTVLALIVSSWNRGKASFTRMFSVVATHLLSAIWPSLQLKQSTSVLSGKSILLSEEADMKVTPVSPISPIIPSKKKTDAEGRPSTFTFPVLSRDGSVSTPIFRVQQDFSSSLGQQHEQGQAVARAPTLKPVVTSVKVVAVSSQPGSPAFDGSKGCQKPCQKLKARIFKCHPPRKVTPAASENSSAEEDVIEGGVEVEAQIKTQDANSPGLTDSPRSTDSPRYRRLSFIKRRPKSSKNGTESDDQLSGQSTTESEIEDVSSPLTRVGAAKAVKPSEVLTLRNPNSEAAGARKKLCRSQELKLSFKNLKKKYKSQELVPVAGGDLECQQLALDAAAVKGLDELAFPFNHETDSSICSTPKTPGPKTEKKKSCLVKMLSCDSDKSGEGTVSSSRGTTTTTSRLSKSITTPVTRMPTEKNTIVDFRPELRKVKTDVARVPLPAEHGELARSSVLDRETLGALLVLAVLAFLLLGKIPAILGTACLCLVLSHVQKFLSNNMTPLERERLAFKSSGGAGLSRLGATSPPRSYGPGSPAVDVQSSEYRKKVLIEGFLDRGNRRMA